MSWKHQAARFFHWLSDVMCDVGCYFEEPYTFEDWHTDVVNRQATRSQKSWSAKMHDIYGCPYGRKDCEVCKPYLG